MWLINNYDTTATQKMQQQIIMGLMVNQPQPLKDAAASFSKLVLQIQC